MLKKFIIDKIDEEQLTETTGNITFHIVDENGDCRKVKASTFLDENKKPQGVSTENIRELPLIEQLFSNRDKKSIDIEFGSFNKVYDRETNKTINQLAYEAVINMKSESKFSRHLSSLFNR